MSFVSLILSAGKSSRMGSPKAWLRYQAETLLERMIRLSLEAEAQKILVVLGAENDSPEYPGLLSQSAVKHTLPTNTLDNITFAIGSPLESPIESIRRGLTALDFRTRVLLWPVDCPFASRDLLETLRDSFEPNADCIARPAIAHKHGHPVLFGIPAVAELQSPVADNGARGVVRRLPERIIDIAHSDPKILANLNTPAEAAEIGIQLP